MVVEKAAVVVEKIEKAVEEVAVLVCVVTDSRPNLDLWRSKILDYACQSE